MYFMAVKKSRKQVLFSDFNIHIQKTRDGAFKGIKKLRQYSVNLPVKQCLEKKPVAQGNLLMPQPAQQAAWKQLQWAQEKTVFTPRVSPARAPVISFAHYFQATNVFDKLDILGLPIRKGKAFQHTERKKQANKQTILQEFCNVTGDTQITSDLGIARMDTFTRGYPKHQRHMRYQQ